MSFDSFMVTPVEIVTPATTVDRYGTAADWDQATTVTVNGWLRQRSTTETHEPGRDPIDTRWVVIFPADTAVSSNCRLIAGGVTYEVDGRPLVAQRREGAHHLEVPLKLYEG